MYQFQVPDRYLSGVAKRSLSLGERSGSDIQHGPLLHTGGVESHRMK